MITLFGLISTSFYSSNRRKKNIEMRRKRQTDDLYSSTFIQRIIADTKSSLQPNIHHPLRTHDDDKSSNKHESVHSPLISFGLALHFTCRYLQKCYLCWSSPFRLHLLHLFPPHVLFSPLLQY